MGGEIRSSEATKWSTNKSLEVAHELTSADFPAPQWTSEIITIPRTLNIVR